MKWKILVIILVVITLLGFGIKFAADKVFNYLLFSNLIGSDLNSGLAPSDEDNKVSESAEPDPTEPDTTDSNNTIDGNMISTKEETETETETKTDTNIQTETNTQKEIKIQAVEKVDTKSDSKPIVESKTSVEKEKERTDDNKVYNKEQDAIVIQEKDTIEKTPEGMVIEDSIPANIKSLGNNILKFFKKNKDNENEQNKVAQKQEANGKSVAERPVIVIPEEKELSEDNSEKTTDNDAERLIKEAEKKVSTADKLRATQILLSKLSASDISILKSMITGGKVTDEEIGKAKQIIKEKVTEDEKEILKSMFNKYQYILDD